MLFPSQAKNKEVGVGVSQSGWRQQGRLALACCRLYDQKGWIHGCPSSYKELLLTWSVFLLSLFQMYASRWLIRHSDEVAEEEICVVLDDDGDRLDIVSIVMANQNQPKRKQILRRGQVPCMLWLLSVPLPSYRRHLHGLSAWTLARNMNVKNGRAETFPWW